MKFNVRQGVAGILCAIVILAASGCIHEENAPQNVTPAPTSEMDSPVGTPQNATPAPTSETDSPVGTPQNATPAPTSETDSPVNSDTSSNPEKALDNYISVVCNGKVNKLEKLAPAEYWECLEDENDVSMKDAEEQMEELNKTLIRGLEDEYGDNIKVSYKILEKDDASSSDLDGMKDYIKSNYDIPKKSVTDAVELEVELTVRGDDDEETTESTFYAVKVDEDWYICSANGAFVGG